MENFDQNDAPESRPALSEVEQPDPKGISFQMEQMDFYAMEDARIAIRTKTRSAFVIDAINHYVGVIQATGAKPGTPEARTPGGQIMELFGVLGLSGPDFTDLLDRVSEAQVLGGDSIWNFVLHRLADILGE